NLSSTTESVNTFCQSFVNSFYYCNCMKRNKQTGSAGLMILMRMSIKSKGRNVPAFFISRTVSAWFPFSQAWKQKDKLQKRTAQRQHPHRQLPLVLSRNRNQSLLVLRLYLH